MNAGRLHNSRFASVVGLLGARAGLSFHASDQERVETGISNAMRRRGQSDPVEYRRLVERDSDAWDELIVELTVGETYFFREPAQFTFIQDEAIPELLAQRPPDHTIRIWSAGCASGEEAYSLAMLLDQQNLLQRSHILATDISTAALAKARKAEYSDWSLRGQGAARAAPYLQREAGTNTLASRIRSHVTFEMLNLAVDTYPSIISGTQNFDLILCRNVLIYFDRETVKSIAKRFHAALADGGWLITASGDPHLDDYAPLHTVVRNSGVFYQRTAAVISQPAVPQRSWVVGDAPEIDVQPPKPINPPAAKRYAAAATEASDPQSVLADAQRALARGRYQQAIQLTADHIANPQACVVQVQALANVDLERAEIACAAATERHPLSAQLHYLHAVLLSERDHCSAAAQAARRAIYLDHTLAFVHLLLGSILRKTGDLTGALRAFRNAQDLCGLLPNDKVVLYSDGQTAAQIANAAKHQIQAIASVSGVR